MESNPSIRRAVTLSTSGTPVMSTVPGSTVRLPQGAVAFIPSSGASARSRAAFDAIKHENELLATQVHSLRASLDEAQSQIKQLRMESKVHLDDEMVNRALSPAQFSRALEQVRPSAPGPSPLMHWQHGGQVGGARFQSPELGTGVIGVPTTHHYHGPVHFHFHGSPPGLAGMDQPPPWGETAGDRAGGRGSGGGAAGATLIVSSISASGLKNRDKKGRSDPFVRLRSGPPGKAVVDSARKDNTLSPVWSDELSLALPGGVSSFTVEVLDWDHKGSEPLGSAQVDMGPKAGDGPITLKLQGTNDEVNADSTCTLTWRLVREEAALPRASSGRTSEVHASLLASTAVNALPSSRSASAATAAPKGVFKLGPVACKELKNRDVKGRSDPFLRVRGASPSSAHVESSRKDNDLNPKWENVLEVELPAGEEAVLVEVWDWDKGGAESLGHVEVPIATRPKGDAVNMQLSGNPQEVTPQSSIQLTWSWTLSAHKVPILPDGTSAPRPAPPKSKIPEGARPLPPPAKPGARAIR
mmetsp:Transcript_23865/g.74289  ORF Transcript_23865/g.74289 Transcript_23865/m.74289 type:complete len:528 (-) Transcript_23865:231-1814(-)